MNSHYYLNIGEENGVLFSAAVGQTISSYSGTGLGKSQFNNNDSTWKNGGSMIATSGNGGWESPNTATGDAYTPRPENLKRTLNFVYNRIISNYAAGNFTLGDIFKHYLCIGIKNNIDKKVSKPDLYIYASSNSVKKLD